MKAIVYERTGPSSVLQPRDREVAAPSRGQVRVRVIVSGVNPTDWKARQGGGTSRALSLPQVPNQDGAGVVDAVGSGVNDLRIGDRVWLWDTAWKRADGTAQQYVNLPRKHVVSLPATESFDTGAPLGIPALTAHRALTARGDAPRVLTPTGLRGQVVLVTGGAGAVGHAAIQLAHWAGATVITTVSGERKAELAHNAGAQHVINYRTENVEQEIQQISTRGVDMIVEVNPLANLAIDVNVIAAGGTIAIYAADSDEPLPVPVRPSMTKNVQYQFILTYTVTDQQKADALAGVSAALADGALRVGDANGLPITRFPLAETAAAHDAVADGAIGKVLIDVPAPADT